MSPSIGLARLHLWATYSISQTSTGEMHRMIVSVRLITAETHSPGLDMEMWEAWYCQDGVTVFFGTNKENQDVLMVSEIVHAPPNLVTEV